MCVRCVCSSGHTCIPPKKWRNAGTFVWVHAVWGAGVYHQPICWRVWCEWCWLNAHACMHASSPSCMSERNILSHSFLLAARPRYYLQSCHHMAGRIAELNYVSPSSTAHLISNFHSMEMWVPLIRKAKATGNRQTKQNIVGWFWNLDSGSFYMYTM